MPLRTFLNLRTNISQKCEVFRGGLEFKADRHLYHSSLGSKGIERKRVPLDEAGEPQTVLTQEHLKCSPMPRVQGGSRGGGVSYG